MRTQFRLFLASFLFLTLLSGCAGNLLSGIDHAPVLNRIKQSGELVVGTSGKMPPMNMTMPDGEVVGLDIDIARLMADSMNVELRIETMQFTELLPSLKTGKVDVVISNVTITPQRNMDVAFVGPYLKSGKCVLSKQEAIAKAQEIEEINIPGVRFAALAGSTSQKFVESLLPQVTMITPADLDSAITMLEQNEVDALLTDYPICMSTLQRFPDNGFISFFSLLNYEPIGIALPPNDPLFVNWAENFLERMENTEVLEALSKHWLSQ